MQSGAAGPRLSKEFTEEARRVSMSGDKNSREDLAAMYSNEVNKHKRTEEKKRASVQAKRPSKEMLDADGLPIAGTNLDGPDLHPALAGQLQKGSKESVKRPSKDSVKKGSKDSMVSFAPEEAPSGAEPERVPIARERRSIREVLRERPDKGGSSRTISEKTLDPERFKDRNFLEDIFLCYDPNGDGTGSLGYREFSKLVKDLGMKLNKKEVEGMMNQLDLNGNGLIEIEEFHFFFNHATNRDDLKGHAEDMCGSQNMFIRKLFEEFGDPEGRGIDFQGLQEMAKVCQLDKGEHAVKPKELKQFFKRMDSGKTGFVTQQKVEFFFENVQARDQLKEYMQASSADNTLMLQQVFEKFDSSRSGSMNELDLLAAAQFLGYKITESGVVELLEKIDSDRNGTVEANEFLDFFDQVRNTEELMEELENFKKGKEQKKYVLGAGWLLTTLLIGSGAVLLSMDMDSVMNAYGMASIFIGGVIGAMLGVPALAPHMYDVMLSQFKSCLSSGSRAIQCGMLLFITITGMALYQMLNPNNPYRAIISILLPIMLVVFAIGVVGAIFRGMCQSAGYLDPVSDSEDEKDLDPKKKSGSKKYSADLEKGNPPPPKKAF
jgi:Ca2+-binding EF-hand superfamily protein